MASGYYIGLCNIKTNDSHSKLILFIFHSKFPIASTKSEVIAINVISINKITFQAVNDTGFISMSSEVLKRKSVRLIPIMV